MKKLVLVCCFAFIASVAYGQMIKAVVIDINENKVFLDVAAPKVKVGDVLSITKEDTYMIHPVTKKKIKKEGEILADLEIESVFDEYSVAVAYPEGVINKIKKGMVAKMPELSFSTESKGVVDEVKDNVVKNNRTVTVNYGTPVELRPKNAIYARDVKYGDAVEFRVVKDIFKNGDVVIPTGTTAKGVVTEAKKSSIAGTKGRLRVELKHLVLEDGNIVPLSGNIYVTGKNRTPLSVITSLFLWPCIFIPGSKAVITEDYNATATVSAPTDVRIN